MKKCEIVAPGDANLRMVTVPKPLPKPGEILIEVAAVSLNYGERWIIDGGMGEASGSEHALAGRLAHGLSRGRPPRSAIRPLGEVRRHPEHSAGDRDDERRPDPLPEPLSNPRPHRGAPPCSAVATRWAGCLRTPTSPSRVHPGVSPK
jgi:hypothetical protein